MKILDLGCGLRKKEGAIGIDSNPRSGADIIHDLNKFPYPFKDNEFDMIVCNHILEHLDDISKIVAEIYRIAKPMAIIVIKVPHFSGVDAFVDPTHKHFFSFRSFDYFIPETELFKDFPYYSQLKFNIIRKKILFNWFFRRIGLEYIMNKFPGKYEAFLAHISRLPLFT